MASTVLTVTARVDGDARGVVNAFRQGGDSIRAFNNDVNKNALTAGDALKKFGSVTGSILKGVVGVIAGAVTAAGGLATAFTFNAIGKGITRLNTIENATSTLGVIMQSTAAAGDVMQEVLKVVSGTPFNLDQFAMGAKNLIAFGVNAERVPGILRAVGSAAAASGKGAEAVDSMVEALGRAATQGVITGDMVSSLGDQGVPALKILSNAFGVTTDEMQKMISNGAIPALEGIDALTSGIMNGTDGAAGATVSFGGAMEAMRQTFEGAMGGMRASIARFGAKIMGPFMPQLTDMVNAVSPLIDAAGKVVGVLADNLAGKSAGMIEKLIGWMGSLSEKLVLISEAEDPGGAIRTMLQGLAEGNPAVAIFLEVMDALQPILPIITEAIREVGKELPALAGPFGDALTAITPLIPKLAELAAELLPEVVKLLPPLVELLGKFADMLVDALPALSPIVDGLADFIGFLSQDTSSTIADWADGFRELGPVGEIIADVVTALGDFIGNGLLENITDGISNFQSFLTDAQSNLDTVLTAISTAVGLAGAGMEATWTAITTVVQNTWDTIGKIIGAAIGIVIAFFSGDFQKVRTIVFELLGSIRDIWQSTWDGVLNTVKSIWTNVSSAVDTGVKNVISFVKGIPGAVQSALSDAKNWLVDVGSQMISGLINGVKDAAKGIATAAIDAVKGAVQGAKDWLGIKSPSRRTRDEIGKHFGTGVAEGVLSVKPVVDAAMVDLVKFPPQIVDVGARITDVVSTAASTAVPSYYQPAAAAGSAAAQGSGGTVIDIDINIEAGANVDEETLQHMKDELTFAIGGVVDK